MCFTHLIVTVILRDSYSYDPYFKTRKKRTKKLSDLLNVNQPARGGPEIDPKSGIPAPESVHFATTLYSLSNKHHVTILKSYCSESSGQIFCQVPAMCKPLL